MNTQIGDRAVVLGASMAGLLAARVLADAYAQVTVIDRDQLPETPSTGVASPTAATCMRWRRADSKPWRSCSRAHRGTGRPRGAGRGPADRRPLVPQRPPAPAGGHRTGAPVRQPTLPGGSRAGPGAGPAQREGPGPPRHRRAGHHPGWSPRHRGAGAAPGRRQRRGAARRRPGGRRQRPWLAHPSVAGRARLPPAETEQVRIGLGYATRTYRLPPDALDGDLAVLQAATPQHPRTGALQRLEGDRWMLTLAGILGDHPPTDPDGFLAFARSLRFPRHLRGGPRRRAAGRPGRLPLPGQRPAPLRAAAPLPRRPAGDGRRGRQLQPDLRPGHERGRPRGAHPAPPPRARHRAAAPPLVPRPRPRGRRALGHGGRRRPGLPRRPGTPNPKVRLVSAYLARLHAAAAHDARLATAFIRVAGLVAPPQTLLRPGVVLRVLRNGRDTVPTAIWTSSESGRSGV